MATFGWPLALLVLQNSPVVVSTFQITKIPTPSAQTRSTLSYYDYSRRFGIGTSHSISKQPISSSALNLFSINSRLGGGDNRSNDDENGKDESGGTVDQKGSEPSRKSDREQNDADSSSWVESIKQWPLYPSVPEKPPQDIFPNAKNSGDSQALRRIEDEFQSMPLPGDVGIEGPASSRYRDGSNSIFSLWNADSLLEAVVRVGLSESDSDPSNENPQDENVKVGDPKTSKRGVNFSNIVSATKDQLFSRLSARVAQDPSIEESVSSSLINVTTIEEFAAWDSWTEAISKSINDVGTGVEDAITNLNPGSAIEQTAKSAIVDAAVSGAASDPEDKSASSPAGLSKAAESVLKDATVRIGTLVSGATTVLSPASVQLLINQASRAFSGQSKEASEGIEAIASEVVAAAESTARDQGLDVREATERAKGTMQFATDIMGMANVMFAAGYAPLMTEPSSSQSVKTSTSVASKTDPGADAEMAKQAKSQEPPKPLFEEFRTAREIAPSQYATIITKGAEMGCLSGAIYYEDIPSKCRDLKHSLVANGTSADVAWMVSDSLDNEDNFREVDVSESGNRVPGSAVMVRTITIRGFDASDENVDRERILNTICSPNGALLHEKYKVLFHSGLLGVAREIYADVKKYIEWTPADHKIVFNGHSIGGSLSIMMLLLMVEHRGVDFVRSKVLRTYSHGSPPVAMMAKGPSVGSKSRSGNARKNARNIIDEYECEILSEFGLPSSMVYGFVQPWDPIVRFLTKYDALYPLVDDLGDDGVTLYARGPSRSLRPVARGIFNQWQGWPQFRDNWLTTKQEYQSVGIQHLLLPEPLRYLNDRFVSANIGVPPVDTIVRISSTELLPALAKGFPLTTFQISYVPQAIRSFIHHFYPAYEETMQNFATKTAKAAKASRKKEGSADARKRDGPVRLGEPSSRRPTLPLRG